MIFREANGKVVLEIVKMIADDALGQKREHFKIPLPEAYSSWFIMAELALDILKRP